MADAVRKEGKEMTEEQLSGLVMSYYQESTSNESSLQHARRYTLERYRREKYGDEDPNWSQVISSDVRDTVSWFLPALLEIFFGPDFPARFNARNEEDIDQAQLETDYCLNVINQQNNGFLLLYIWLKDCLIQKNGYVHAYWDERVNEETEEYEGITEEEYQRLLIDPDIEITEHTLYDEDGNEYGEDEQPQKPIVKHDVKAVRQEDNSCIKIVNLPPEAVFVAADHHSVDLTDCPCCGYETEVTRSDLLVDGYDEDIVKNLTAANDMLKDTEEKNERDQWNFEKAEKITEARQVDPSRDKIRIIQCYILTDYDGDGKSELRFVKLAGNNGEHVLENEVVSGVQLYAITPEVEPHQHFGTSIAELVEDLQKIRTVLTRQMLNNIYLVNHPQTAYVKGSVDYNDLITRAPGSTVAMKSLGSVETITTPFTAGQSIPIFDELSKRAEARTGISETTQGLNAEWLSKATNLVGTKIMNAAQARILLVARIILETGFKGLFRGVHSLACQYDRERMVEMGNGYTKCNPRLWRKRTAMTIEMGPGFADKASKLLIMQTIQEIQEKIMAVQQGDGPLLNQKQIYNSITDMVKLAGIGNPDKYFTNPDTYKPPAQTKPDPVSEALQIEQMKLKQKAMSEQLDREQKDAFHEDNLAFEVHKFNETLAFEENQHRDDTNHQHREFRVKQFERPATRKLSNQSPDGRELSGSGQET